MSNKTRLQTNNTNLQDLITKANTLPDAGSGGGGLETCTVTLVGESPVLGNEYIYYANGTSVMQMSYMPDFLDENTQITVVKNSIICSNIQLSYTGSIAFTAMGGKYIYFVTGNGTLINM